MSAHPAQSDRVVNEETLINHRVSWLIGSQSVLMTAYVLLRNSPYQYNGNGGVTLTPQYENQTSVLMYVLVMCGILICAAGLLGVIAGFVALNRWRRRAPDPVDATSTWLLHSLGVIAAITPCLTFLVAWLVILRSNFPEAGCWKWIAFWGPACVATIVIGWWTKHEFQREPTRPSPSAGGTPANRDR